MFFIVIDIGQPTGLAFVRLIIENYRIINDVLNIIYVQLLENNFGFISYAVTQEFYNGLNHLNTASASMIK